MNWLTMYIKDKFDESLTVLDLCCGIGDVMDIPAKSIMAVDIYQPYLDIYQSRRPGGNQISTICGDVLDVVKHIDDNAYDLVVCLDGIEHLFEKRAIELLSHLDRIARKSIIIFTTEGFSFNMPVNTWGIKGGDEYQLHKSGFSKSFFRERGFKVSIVNTHINDYDKTEWRAQILCMKDLK